MYLTSLHNHYMPPLLNPLLTYPFLTYFVKSIFSIKYILKLFSNFVSCVLLIFVMILSQIITLDPIHLLLNGLWLF